MPASMVLMSRPVLQLCTAMPALWASSACGQRRIPVPVRHAACAGAACVPGAADPLQNGATWRLLGTEVHRHEHQHKSDDGRWGLVSYVLCHPCWGDSVGMNATLHAVSGSSWLHTASHAARHHCVIHSAAGAPP